MRQPAFSHPLRSAIRAGREPRDIVVFIDRWPPKKRSARRPVLAVLPGDDPALLDWSVCRSQDVIIPAADEVDRDRLTAVCHAIRAVGPRRLLLLTDAAPGHEFVVSRGGAA